MDFARKQLEKYGWKDGQGLGKNEDGIATAIKPKLKFDNSGIGHNVGEQFTNNWWENVFNRAAQNIEVNVNDEGTTVKRKTDEDVEISTKNYSVKELKKNKNLQYGSFLKTEKLTDSGVTSLGSNYELMSYEKVVQPLTDEELFAACGGRTAHKGARHGLKLEGKLSRIEKQERMLLKKMKSVSITENPITTEKKIRKLKTCKEKCKKVKEMEVDEVSTDSSPFKKKKKKKRSVSFNETITEYYIPPSEQDTSSGSSLRDENSNEQGLLDPAASSSNSNKIDEGIEIDINDNRNNDDPPPFIRYKDISKAECKLKKKRDNRATMKFLNDVLQYEFDAQVNCKKRKVILDDTDDSFKKKLQSCSSRSSTESPERKEKKRNKKKKHKEKKREEKKLDRKEQSFNFLARSLDNVKISNESE